MFKLNNILLSTLFIGALPFASVSSEPTNNCIENSDIKVCKHQTVYIKRILSEEPEEATVLSIKNNTKVVLSYYVNDVKKIDTFKVSKLFITTGCTQSGFFCVLDSVYARGKILNRSKILAINPTSDKIVIKESIALKRLLKVSEKSLYGEGCIKGVCSGDYAVNHWYKASVPPFYIHAVNPTTHQALSSIVYTTFLYQKTHKIKNLTIIRQNPYAER